jgi:TPR repeat protein
MRILRLGAHPVALVIWMGFFCVQAVANPMALSAKSEMDRAVSAAVREDYLTALGIFQVQAAQGEAVAQYNLGLLYLNGLGVPFNPVQARYWLGQSAAQGYVKAKGLLEKLP